MSLHRIYRYESGRRLVIAPQSYPGKVARVSTQGEAGLLLRQLIASETMAGTHARVYYRGISPGRDRGASGHCRPLGKA